jgi:hypothetical protein
VLHRRRRDAVRCSPVACATAATLAVLAGLHTAWGLGSSVPFRDRGVLADTVAGTPDVPVPTACFAVAGLLTSAAALVADAVPVPTTLRRVGVVGVAAVLGVRGVCGLTGRTELLVGWKPSDEFVRLDRTRYGPLCMVLAAGALTSLRRTA